MIVFNTCVYVLFAILYLSLGVLSLRFSEGNKAYTDARDLLERAVYDEAAEHYWKSILLRHQEDDYTVMSYNA
jgi:hypothetical protein